MAINIKRAIKSRGLEVREVARRMGITPTGLSQHINGNPTIDVLNRIAQAIGCDIAELFDPIGNKPTFFAFVKMGDNAFQADSLAELKKIVTEIEERHKESY